MYLSPMETSGHGVFTVFVLVLTIVWAPPCAYGQQVGDSVITNVEAPLLETAAYDSDTLRVLTEGFQSVATGEDGSFVKVRAGTTEGWVLSHFLTTPQALREFQKRRAASDEAGQGYGEVGGSFPWFRGGVFLLSFWWIGLAAMVGYAAHERERDPIPWFALAVLFSPLMVVLVLIAVGDGGG
jgi:hypothetical protein